ncbi:MAG: zinc ribbon domain-containing protein [Candidatus Thorarchaeota archaeon]
MRYEKNQYSAGISICALIIAGIFIYWGINDVLIRPLQGQLFNWFGIVWLGIAAAIIIGQITIWVNKDKLRKAVLYEYEENPSATIEQISTKTGITIKDVQAIVLDLKSRGLLRGKFSSSTGEMVHSEVVKSGQSQPSAGNVKYCPNCGTAKVKESAVFCSYCGSKF